MVLRAMPVIRKWSHDAVERDRRGGIAWQYSCRRQTLPGRGSMIFGARISERELDCRARQRARFRNGAVHDKHRASRSCGLAQSFEHQAPPPASVRLAGFVNTSDCHGRSGGPSLHRGAEKGAPSWMSPSPGSLMEQAGAFADRMQNAYLMCIAARSKGRRVTCQLARPRQYRRSGQTLSPAKTKFSRRHALRPSPGPSPSLLGPDANSPARSASAAGVAWQRVSLLYEVRGRSPLPSMSNADRDPGHTLERVTVVTPLSETTSDTLPKHQQRGGIQSALQVLTVPFASTPPRRGGAYS